jgi:general secretion pathway protein H
LARNTLPQAWLDPQTQSLNARPVLLGPEPIIGPQSVALSTASNTASRPLLWVATDGLRPFTVQTTPPLAAVNPP